MNLKWDLLVSKFGFKWFNLYHYNKVVWDRTSGIGEGHAVGRPAIREDAEEFSGGHLTVRMWPKPFVFRSTMKDMKKGGGDGETATFLGLGGGAAGTCLGQKISVSTTTAVVVNDGDDAAAAAAATGGTGGDDPVLYSTPFVAAPTVVGLYTLNPVDP